ncbi:unnamed protein product [Thelazia callipaeda]|uniref:DEDD_Tnp_IS110 domain-containing protein n=1 Tax=Thelazia callipaeda TaxID=103827 RepID=A0A0N5CTL5_THECL|nr:unnamed protein product [Thelazia callipaeda]
MSKKEMKGILCADESGLNICNLGTLKDGPGDVVTELLRFASCLEPNPQASSVTIHLKGTYYYYYFCMK